jgi:hypothetical protein
MLAGGGPAATHFSCFAKKSKQKKATAESLPLRGSREGEALIGKRNKLASLRQISLLYPIKTSPSRQRQRGLQVKDNVKSNVKGTAPSSPSYWLLLLLIFGVPVGSAEETVVQAEKEVKSV